MQETGRVLRILLFIFGQCDPGRYNRPMPAPRLIMFARYPEPGKAKTRLIPALGGDGAATVHKRLTERTTAQMRKSALAIEIRFTGADASDFESWLGADLDYVAQRDAALPRGDPEGGDLGARLLDAAKEPPVILVGADCPDLQAGHLARAADALTTHDVAIGPAGDGGYWLIGLATRHDWLFTGMKWGTDTVLPETLRRLADRNVAPARLPTLADCDRPEDLPRWPWLTA